MAKRYPKQIGGVTGGYRAVGGMAVERGTTYGNVT